MAIVFHSVKYQDIKIDSQMIIGVMGSDYQLFLKSLRRDQVFYIENNIDTSDSTVQCKLDSLNIKYSEELLMAYLNDLHLAKDFLKKKVNELSHSEQKILKYLLCLVSNASIIVVDEPFLDLDFPNKKMIISIFNRLVRYKTIIIGSSDSNIIYAICKKVLLLGKEKYYYGDVLILSNKNILKQYHLVMPQIVEFIRYAQEKKVHLPYSKDIRDLIKDVYRHVSK